LRRRAHAPSIASTNRNCALISFDLGNIARALAHRPYRIYTIGNATSLIGTWMQRVSIGWLTWQLTGSGAWLGIIAFSDLFPTVVLSPLAGTLADRYDRVLILRCTQIAAALQATTLAVLTATGLMTIWLLLGLSLLMGCLNAFAQPARLALISALVTPASLPAAVAINSVVFNSARFVGPMVAGYAIAHGGTPLAFAYNAASFMVFMVALIFARPDLPARRRARANVLRESIAGYVYVARHKALGPLFAFYATTAILGRGFVELLPGFAAGVYNRGPVGLAWLTASIGIGAIGGGLVMAARPGLGGLTRYVVVHTLILSLAVAVFAVSGAFPIAVPALLVAGFSMVTTGAGMQTLIQSAVDADMRGRVLGAYGMIFRGGTAVGAMLVGAVSDFVGLQWPVAAGALICVLLACWAITRVGTLAPMVEQPAGTDE
jgi:MFS family permease